MSAGANKNCITEITNEGEKIETGVFWSVEECQMTAEWRRGLLLRWRRVAEEQIMNADK